MEKQISFTDLEYGKRRKVTKREVFLTKMDAVLPWKEWVELVRPFFPDGKRGRPPQEIEVMLRMLMLQVWFQLSDEGVEDAIYDSYAMKSFLGLNFAKGAQVPDATTLCKFRKLLHTHGLQKTFFDQVQEVLKAEGKQVKGAQSLMRRSLRRLIRGKMPESSGTRKCTRSRKARNGTSGCASTLAQILCMVLYIPYPPRRPMPQRSRKRPTYCGKTMRWSMEMRATANWIAM